MAGTWPNGPLCAGRASPVWGYVEQLPTSIDTPVRWSEAELAELQYPAAVEEVSGCGGCFDARALAQAAEAQPHAAAGFSRE